MDNDDRQVGRILSRREVLALFGAAGATMLVGCGPSQTGGGATVAPAGTSASQAPTAAAATPALNAEAATAVTLPSNPTAQATAAAEVATAQTDNTTVASGNGTAAPACVVRPEVTEGPYYVAENLVRSDIRADSTTGTVKEGTPLALTFNISQVSNSACTPLQGATVEIWHCDATGQYSDVSDPGFNTKGQNWLRGDGIEAGVHYPVPLHLQPALTHLGYVRGAFPEAERAADEVLSLPMFPLMSDEQQDRVVEALLAALNN